MQIFRANIELAERVEESADDITAAETAPNPMNDTAGGVKYCKTKGRTRVASSGYKVPSTVTLVYEVSFQSEI